MVYANQKKTVQQDELDSWSQVPGPSKNGDNYEKWGPLKWGPKLIWSHCQGERDAKNPNKQTKKTNLKCIWSLASHHLDGMGKSPIPELKWVGVNSWYSSILDRNV